MVCKYAKYTPVDGLISNLVKSIGIDHDGNKWFGTIEGLSKFDGINWSGFTSFTDNLSQNDVWFIAIDADNNKWFCTGSNGISKFDGANRLN